MEVATAAGADVTALNPKAGLGVEACWTSGKRAIELSNSEEWINSASEAIESNPTTGESL
jgi:hypothetical protein